MKVAELKQRLVPGTKLRLVNSLLGPCDKLRVVAGVNTVDVTFTGDGIRPGEVSHLRWPKASELRETPAGFEVLEGGEVAAAYLWADVVVTDRGGDLVSLFAATPRAEAWLAANFPIPPGPDGNLVTEHESIGGLEREAAEAGLIVAIPPRVKRAVDALEGTLRRWLAAARQTSDFTVEYVAPLYCVQPLTAKARAWLVENLTDEQTWLGGGLMVESDLVTDLVIAMRDAGLSQKGELTP